MSQVPSTVTFVAVPSTPQNGHVNRWEMHVNDVPTAHWLCKHEFLAAVDHLSDRLQALGHKIKWRGRF